MSNTLEEQCVRADSGRPQIESRKKRACGIFLVGLILTVLGAIGTNSDNIPALGWIVHPQYTGAKICFDQLLQDRQVTHTDPGFQMLSEIVEANLTNNTSQAVYLKCARLEAGVIGFNADGRPTTLEPITLEFHTGAQTQVDLQVLLHAIEQVRKRSKAKYSLFLTTAGIIVFIVGFVRKNA